MSELSPETRAWIDAVGDGDAPRPEDRARIRQRLAVELGAAALATTTLAVATQASATASSASTAASSLALGKASAGMGLLTKIAVAAAVAGAISTTAFVAVHRAPAPQRVKVSAATIGAASSQHARALPAAKPVIAPVVEQLVPKEEEVAAAVTPVVTKRHNQVRADAKVPIEPTRGSSIAEEIALLREAQTALREGRIDDALSRTAAHAERFPGGALREERAAVEMLARCEQGSATSDMVESFLAATPESPLKARVRAACSAGR